MPSRSTLDVTPTPTGVVPVGPGPAGPRHIVPVSRRGLRPDPELVTCRDCQVSCQSACKTSCTVGNQRCPK